MNDKTTMNWDRQICFHPIGFVQNDYDEPAGPHAMRDIPSRIILNDALVGALDGLEIGQPILVLFHFDRSPDDFDLHQHPCGDKTLLKRGIFALCTPHRPNGIGVTQVELLKIESNVLTVLGLDALNNTPVLDIKPG